MYNTERCSSGNIIRLTGCTISDYNKLYHMRYKMLDRCYNCQSKPYKNYGGRGISVCKEWVEEPESFYVFAMNNGFKHGVEIDRIDNDGNYSPDNVRFVDTKTNMRNRRDNTHITINGKTKVLAEWAEISGVSRVLIMWRYRRGIRGTGLLAPEFHGTNITIEGETKHAREWAAIAGISTSGLMKRYNRGVSGKELLLPYRKCKYDCRGLHKK